MASVCLTQTLSRTEILMVGSFILDCSKCFFFAKFNEATKVTCAESWLFRMASHLQGGSCLCLCSGASNHRLGEVLQGLRWQPSMLSAVHTTRENPKIQVTTVHSSVATKTETQSPVRRRSAHPLPDLHISHAKQTRNQQTNGTRTQSKQSPQLALGIERSIDTLCQTKIGKSKTKGGFYFVSKNQVPKRNPKLAP